MTRFREVTSIGERPILHCEVMEEEEGKLFSNVHFAM